MNSQQQGDTSKEGTTSSQSVSQSDVSILVSLAKQVAKDVSNRSSSTMTNAGAVSGNEQQSQQPKREKQQQQQQQQQQLLPPSHPPPSQQEQQQRTHQFQSQQLQQQYVQNAGLGTVAQDIMSLLQHGGSNNDRQKMIEKLVLNMHSGVSELQKVVSQLLLSRSAALSSLPAASAAPMVSPQGQGQSQCQFISNTSSSYQQQSAGRGTSFVSIQEDPIQNPTTSQNSLQRQPANDRGLSLTNVASSNKMHDDEAEKTTLSTRMIPCKARGMSTEHSFVTAYFVLHENMKHGEDLVCSFAACRDTGIKFRYCKYCGGSVAKRNFAKRHSHSDLTAKEKVSSVNNRTDADAAIPECATEDALDEDNDSNNVARDSKESSETDDQVVIREGARVLPPPPFNQHSRRIISDTDSRSSQIAAAKKPPASREYKPLFTATDYRKKRWAQLLRSRPDEMESDNMSAWISEVLAVSNICEPLKRPSTTDIENNESNKKARFEDTSSSAESLVGEKEQINSLNLSSSSTSEHDDAKHPSKVDSTSGSSKTSEEADINTSQFLLDSKTDEGSNGSTSSSTHSPLSDTNERSSETTSSRSEMNRTSPKADVEGNASTTSSAHSTASDTNDETKRDEGENASTRSSANSTSSNVNGRSSEMASSTSRDSSVPERTNEMVVNQVRFDNLKNSEEMDCLSNDSSDDYEN